MRVPSKAVVTTFLLLTSYSLSPPTFTFALCPLTFALTREAGDVLALLEAYQAEPQAAVRGSLSDRTLAQTHAALRKDALSWIAAKGAADANRRRLIAATFALEVAGAELETQAHDVPPLIEWGCEQVRKRLPSEAERLWHEAALAALEGLGNAQAVETHLAHVTARFPNDARWQHARVWLADARTLHVHPRQPLTSEKVPFPAALAAQYEALASTPGRASEALTRVGFFHFLSGAHAEARASLARAASAADATAESRYLGHLFLSWIAEREQQPDLVITELRRALEAAPHGRTASIWLAMRYQLSSRGADAQSVAARSLALATDRADPWRAFYGGDVARWPELVAALRKVAR